MQDPLIAQLFPDMPSVPLQRPYSSHAQPRLEELRDLYSHGIFGIEQPPEGDAALLQPDYFCGGYDLSYMVSHAMRMFSPQPVVRSTFLYAQMLCSATFPSSHYTRRQGMPSYLLTQTFYGRGTLHYGGQSCELAPGDVFLIDCRAPHEYAAAGEEGWGYRLVHFDGAAMPGYFALLAAQGAYHFPMGDDARFTELFRELFDVGLSDSLGRNVEINRILTDMVCRLLGRLSSERQAALPAVVKQLRAFLQDSCRRHLTLDDIARSVNLSKFYASRIFKQHTGKTLFQYLQDCRLRLARQLLCSSEMSVQAIADWCGFEDAGNFYRAFEKQEGLSPSRYRRLCALSAVSAAAGAAGADAATGADAAARADAATRANAAGAVQPAAAARQMPDPPPSHPPAQR